MPFLRPDADDADGGWTNEAGGTTLFSSVDETVADDADYIKSSASPSDDIVRLRLSNPSGAVTTPFVVRYEYGKTGTESVNLDVTLIEVSATTTWNSADKSAGITLSGDDLVATATSLASLGVRSIASVSSGKRYAEATLVKVGTPDLVFGLSNASLPIATLPDVGNDGVAWYESGIVGFNDSLIDTIQGYADTDVLCMAADFDAELVWFRTVADADWNDDPSADPETGTGGIDFSVINAGPYFLHFNCTGVADNVLTLNTGATAYAGSRPTGFSDWGGTDTEIASWTHTNISSTLDTAEQTLTQDEFDAITDFDSLFIELRAYQMSLVTIPGGMLFPNFNNTAAGGLMFSVGTNFANDAATEKFAFIGQLYIEGRATGKTLDTTGSSAISFCTVSTHVLANGTTSIDIGIQDVATGSGPPARPDGTFDVKAVVTAASPGGLIASTWTSIVPTTGSKTMSHGDLIAVVWDMTARGGVDVFGARSGAGAITFAEPICVFDTGGGWTQNASLPNVVITFSDGTLGIIDGALPFKEFQNSAAFSNSTNPDERGMLFQVPFDCEVDALFASVVGTDAASDYTITLYEDPLGTPASIGSYSFLSEQRPNATTQRRRTAVLPAPVALTKNTDYVVAVKADGTTNINTLYGTMGSQAHRIFLPYGLTGKQAVRNNSAGAFDPEDTPISIYEMGVRICSVMT